ncbi:MAG: hypothetical protein Q9195_008123 [Heterodermia aff. obscurata]
MSLPASNNPQASSPSIIGRSFDLQPSELEMARIRYVGRSKPCYVNPPFQEAVNDLNKKQGTQEQINADTYSTHRTHDLISAAQQPIDPQTNCLFFHTHHGLPLEIRTMIFEYVLASYEDYSRPRHPPPVLSTQLSSDRLRKEALDSGHLGLYYHRRVDTALLRTCQRIYRETYLTPIIRNTHSLYYGPRGVCSTSPGVAATYFQGMAPQQLAAVKNMQLFVGYDHFNAMNPGWFLDSTCFADLGFVRGTRRLNRTDILGGPYPQNLTLTISQMDLCVAEIPINFEQFLRNERWECVFGGLKRLKLEMEIAVCRKERFIESRVLDRLRGYVFDIGNGQILQAKGNQFDERSWKRPCDHYVESDQQGCMMCDFWLVGITWQVKDKE